MNANDIKRLCALGETSRVQFKQTLDSTKKMAAEMVAFANGRGGIILFGVEDKRGEIVGLDYAQLQRISSDVSNVANSLSPIIYLQTETVDVDGRIVLVVNINEGISKPYKDQSGNIWVKQGSDKRRIIENSEILSLFQQSGNYRPDENAVAGTTIDDLDRFELNDYLEKFYGKTIGDFDMPARQLLENLQLMRPTGELTLAGLMFFGKMPQRFCPSMMIKAVTFMGNDMAGLEYLDSKDITGTIPRMFQQAMMFLKSNLHARQAGQSFNSVGKLEISEVALEELMQNALVHRDYLINAPIRLMIFDNRVEICSPGGLPSGVDTASIRFGKTRQRNPLMATFCAKTMNYRGLGTGILRALKECPDMLFVNDEDSEFKVVITRPLYDNRYVSDTSVEKPSYRQLMAREEDANYKPMIVKEDEPLRGYLADNEQERFVAALPRRDREDARRLLRLCQQPQGVLEMMEAIEYDSRTTFRRRLLTPMLNAGLLVPTIKGSPNSPKQRYVLAQ